MSAVSIKATLSNLSVASDDDLLDVFGRLSIAKQLRKRDLAAIDAELLRREGVGEFPAPIATPEQQRVDELVRRGYPYAEAYAEAYGVSPGRVAAEERAALVDKRAGETREQAIRRGYAEMVTLQALQAEEVTRGNLLSGRCPGVDAASLWSGQGARARKCASEELLRFWEELGGRRTYTEFRAGLVGGRSARVKAEAVRAGGQGRDFGV